MHYYTDGFFKGIRLHRIIYNIFDMDIFKGFLINTDIHFLKTIIDDKYNSAIFYLLF